MGRIKLFAFYVARAYATTIGNGSSAICARNNGLAMCFRSFLNFDAQGSRLFPSSVTAEPYGSINAYEASPARYLGVKKGQGSNLRLSRLVANGLSPKSAEFLAENLNLPASEFTIHYVQVPKQTMARRKALGKLNVAESDRVARFAQLLKQATDMMEGNQSAAIGWLKSSQILLENQTPLEYARTESGAAEVQQLIGRIERGVYS